MSAERLTGLRKGDPGDLDLAGRHVVVRLSVQLMGGVHARFLGIIGQPSK